MALPLRSSGPGALRGRILARLPLTLPFSMCDSFPNWATYIVEYVPMSVFVKPTVELA